MFSDQYWLNICKSISGNSKCFSRKLSAIIVKDNKFIISTGYNGPPSGCKHCNDQDYREYLVGLKGMLNWDSKYDNPDSCPRREPLDFKSGEGLEYCQAAHAERNAISIAAKLGHSTDNCIMYLNCIIPCFECAKSIINAGIKEVIVEKLEDYETSGITGRYLLEQAGVKIREFKL